MSLPSPADYGLDGVFASEADRKAAHDRYLADWYLARALDRDNHLTAREGDAKFAVLEEWIYERAGLSRSDASVSEPPPNPDLLPAPGAS